MRLENRAGLPAEEVEALSRELSRLGSLEDLMSWGFAARPPHELVEVVHQDEFCLDVVVGWRGELFLVFDTT